MKMTNDNTKIKRDKVNIPRDVATRYNLYRSEPDLFPAFERTRFVCVPLNWLPVGLSDVTGAVNDNNAKVLRYWPALVYNNFADLVSDLSPNEMKAIKEKLMLEHRKSITPVARLIGWGGHSRECEEKELSGATIDFQEKELYLIRLSGRPIIDVAWMDNDNDEILSFNEQIKFGASIDFIIEWIVQNGKGRQRLAAWKTHAMQYNRAMEMALCMIAIDLDVEPLPAKELGFYTADSTSNNELCSHFTKSSRFPASSCKCLFDKVSK